MSTTTAIAPRRPGRLLALSRGEASRTERILCLAAFVVLVCARLPNVTLHGRVWAEEGFRYLWYAAWWPWPDALFVSWGGYLNVVANAAGVLAWHLVPLDYVPRVEFAIGLFFQCCPAILLVTSRAAWLRPRAALIAALLLLVLAPLSDEIWLNTIHAQFELALCTALILVLEPRRRMVGGFRLALLALGPLSGPGSILVLPLFCLRTLVERTRERLIHTAVLGTATLVQLAFFYVPDPGRTISVGPRLLLDELFSRLIVSPLVGHDTAVGTGEWMFAHLDSPALRLWLPSATILISVIVAAVLFSARRAQAVWMVATAGILAVIALLGAINPGPYLLYPWAGFRYSFAPVVLLGWALVSLAVEGEGLVPTLAAALVVWRIGVGAIDYGYPEPLYNQGPDWQAEVAAWRKNPDYRLRLWPRNWRLDLPPPGYRPDPEDLPHGPVWR